MVKKMPTAKRKKATKKRATKKKTTKKKAQVAAEDTPKEEEKPKEKPKSYIDDVVEVHKKVLSGFKYVTDEVQYGRIEDWRIPENCERVIGDCDDFAIACRELLREKGHEPRLVFCTTETGGGHLVCVLGKMVLDNRQRTAVTIKSLADSRTPYHFISASGTSPGEEWRSIKLSWESSGEADLQEV
jgi:predicted transglutaminase-like cysteine proteinase